MNLEKVRFKNLSGGLKTIVVISWIIAGIESLALILGFIAGLNTGVY